jgi:hypothetical protein
MKKQLLKLGRVIFPAALFCLLFTLTAGAQNNCTPAPSGLTSWWPADGFSLDLAGTNNGVLQGGATYAAGEVGQAFRLDGTNGFVSTSLTVTNPQTFTLGLWFKSSTTRGGVLLSFGDSQTGTPANYDRHIYMDNAGALHFGVNSSGTKVISSTNGLNNNSWHFVAGVLSSNAGMSLYIDGGLMATNVAVTNAQNFNGWWRIGENNLANWPSLPSSYFFNGQIDEVSIFNRALASNEIASIYQAGNSGMCYTNTPVPVFVQNPVGLTNYVAVAFSLSGAAMGTPRPQYQWLTNGIPLTGATNPSLIFNNPTTNQSGAYTLVASNIFGSTTSSVANVTILVPAFPAATEGFESGFDGWTTDNSAVWQVGTPTKANGSPTNSLGYQTHSGTNCAVTVLNANYPVSANSRLISPAFTVPAATNSPRLRFWHWYAFANSCANDYGEVEVRVVGSNTWTTISPQYINGSGVWSEPSIDLTAYAGQTVQVAFHMVYQNCSSLTDPGWYVDDVTLVTGAQQTLVANVPQDFESGQGDWSVDNGVWQVGTPTKANGSPTNSLGYQTHSGTNCAVTVLNANYPVSANSRLISPAFTVPAATNSPRLRFWHWYAFANSCANDYGEVEVRVVGSNTWTTISPQYINGSGVWSEPSIDLTAYAGQTVQVAFHMVYQNCSSLTDPGWYVDDVTLVTGAGLQIVLPMPISSPQLGGATFSQATVQVQDQGTTVLNWATPITATAFPSGVGSLHGTTNVNVNSSTGSATFTNLYYALANSNIAQSVTLVFNTSSLSPVTNAPIMVDFPISEFSASSSNSQVLIDPTSEAGLNSWTVNGTDVSYQHWYWLRIGSNAPQFSLDSLSKPYGLYQSQTNTTVNYLGQGLSATLAFSLTGGVNGSSASSLIESLTIQNVTNTTIDLHVFEYSDFDLSDDPSADTLAFPTANAVVQQGSGLTLTETIGTPVPNYYEGSWYAITLDKISGGSPVTLSDSLIPNSPGDQTFAHEWDTNLAAGQTIVISLTNSITGSISTTPVVLSVALSGNNVVISWPTNGTPDFQLQSTTTLSAGSSWTTVSSSPIINGNVYQVILPILPGAQYFRLQN